MRMLNDKIYNLLESQTRINVSKTLSLLFVQRIPSTRLGKFTNTSMITMSVRCFGIPSLFISVFLTTKALR